MRWIAARIGRSLSTISREPARNSERDGRYRASSAHALAYQRASRPKPGKLLSNLVLRQRVEQDLAKRYSPEQIVGRLRLDFPDDPTMRISVETIYRSLYVPSRGGLHRELTTCLRTGRQLRRLHRSACQTRRWTIAVTAERPPRGRLS
jgi:transposase, IS30 family